ncbi:hypothetical protein D3C77_542910 [compost metagenome]
MVALTPMSFPAVLIASRTPASVLLFSSIVTEKDSVVFGAGGMPGTPSETSNVPLVKRAGASAVLGIAASATLLLLASDLTSS